MLSTDHPYQKITKATVFLDDAPLASRNCERIAQDNAERVLTI
jgi:predicted TIM-barrel fold metal-dependent hydrolase